MKKHFTLKLKPSEAADDNYLKKIVAAETGYIPSEITGYTILKKSIDVTLHDVAFFDGRRAGSSS